MKENESSGTADEFNQKCQHERNPGKILTVRLPTFKDVLEVQLCLIHGHALTFVHRNTPAEIQGHLRALRHHAAALRDRENFVANCPLRAIGELHHRVVCFSKKNENKRAKEDF